MASEEYDLLVVESAAPRQDGLMILASKTQSTRSSHAVRADVTDVNQILKPEEVAVSWIVFFVVAALIGLSAFGLVSGFALAEASFLFLAILVLSTLWLLSSWGSVSKQ
jgi:hypothetical protein